MLRLFFLIVLLSTFSPHVFWAQTIPIAQARAQPIGNQVTVRGLVTNGPELGKIRFLQDQSAGIAAFPGSGSQAGFESNVQLGDSIEIRGNLVDYNGLLEISPILSYQVVSRNRPLPAPKPVSLINLNEDLEGQLLSIDCLSFTTSANTFANSGEYTVADALGNTAKIYLRSGHPMLNATIPQGPVRIQAILSAYGNFQLLPRSVADFSSATCFFLSSPLQQSEIETTSFRLNWETNSTGKGYLQYGPAPDSLNLSVGTGLFTKNHSVLLQQLQPGTIYWTQAVIASGVDTIYSSIFPFATKSTSSGQIKVYFNQGIDLSAADGLSPDGNSYVDVLSETLNRINSAKHSIDAAIYNNNRADLTAALQMAQTRGVRVRYIAAQSTDNSALSPSPNFPVLYGNADALMHNKFLVIDANFPDEAWVMSGSLNWTNGNMIQDYNNTLFIQDQSLARTYELEFEEMWGSNSATPNANNSRFGNTKKDNTPHQFIIGGRKVESYFSPSDQVTQQIVRAIQTADHKASFAIFSFTKNEIGDAFIGVHQSGAWVRGIVENINDIGAEYSVLQSSGVPTKDHPAFSLLHHKYAVIDGGYPASDPVVVTGSHNWTQAAESSNDENTLLIHDPNLAILYQAEFEQRWQETGTSSSIAVPEEFEVYPNPVRDQLFIKLRKDVSWSGTVEICNLLGQKIKAQQLQGPTASLELNSLAAGNYFVRFITNRGIYTIPVQALPH